MDISEGGLLLYIPEEIEIGKNLRLKIFFDSGRKLKSIEANVQVVWKDFFLKKIDFYRNGVKFVDILSEDIEKLRNFLINLMNVKVTSDLNIPPRLLSAIGISTFGGFSYLTHKVPDQD